MIACLPNGAQPPHGLNGAAHPLQRATIGNNSGNAVDPGLATDFADNGPLALRTDVSPEALEAFREAIRSQGNEDVRQSSITNAMHRARANAT
jgi:hypothetical protein